MEILKLIEVTPLVLKLLVLSSAIDKLVVFPVPSPCSMASCIFCWVALLLTNTNLAKLFSFRPNQIPVCCEPLSGVVPAKLGCAIVAVISITLVEVTKPTPKAFICELVNVL